MLLRLCVMVSIGAGIGWITNWIAIKMLFHPYQKKHFLFFKIQGLIPKRRDEIGKGISQVVEQELISLQEILEQVDVEGMFVRIERMVEQHLDENLERQIKEIFPFAAMFLSKESIAKIKVFIKEGLLEKKDDICLSFGEYLEEKVDFQEMIQEKISSFSLEKLEEIISSLAKKELKHIELIGAFLGALLGGAQFLLFSYFM